MKLLRRFRILGTTIEGYGYEYSPRKMIAVSIGIMSICIVMGYYYKLNKLSILFLFIFVMLIYPSIIRAQFKLIRNNMMFEQLSSYMDYMILSFKRNPKILNAMEETLPMVSGKMKKCLEEAINTIKTDTSEDVYYKAFDRIEREFRTSRLKTLHRFMLNVERENSKSYRSNIDTLYYDIHNWVTRMYGFQSRIKESKINILISILISMIIVVYFCQTVYKVSSSIEGFDVIGTRVYQAATLLYLVLVSGLYVFVNSKLNGIWLIEDLKSIKDDRILKVIEKAEGYDVDAGKKRSRKRAFCLVPIICLGIVLNKGLFVIVGVVLFAIISTNSTRIYKSRISQVRKSMLKEFPAWLREVSVNLYTMVGVNAISASYENAPTVLKPFIERFMINVENDPVSIYPYDSFLGMFYVPELATSIKTLYSLQSQSSDESQKQINDLTERNQHLIAKSEELRLKDTISSIKFLSAVPMLAMTGKLMCDMVMVLIELTTAL